eukprot:174318-Lingulodinium_polyedra.AAC.1
MRRAQRAPAQQTTYHARRNAWIHGGTEHAARSASQMKHNAQTAMQDQTPDATNASCKFRDGETATYTHGR